MNILISNDDGINAIGINTLINALSKNNDVYVIAPDRERSAAGHSITLNTPLRVEKTDAKNGAKAAWKISGTPGDCVKIGINSVLSPKERPDIVISGINHGPNLGHDILYSGTVSCAIEAAMMNIPAIAVSLCDFSKNIDDYKPVAEFIHKLLPKLQNFNFPKNIVLNINYPNIDKEDISGIKITKMGSKIFTDDYEKRIDPRGNTYYWMAGKMITNHDETNTDISAIRNNYISITPLSFNMTAENVISDLDGFICNNNFCNPF